MIVAAAMLHRSTAVQSVVRYTGVLMPALLVVLQELVGDGVLACKI